GRAPNPSGRPSRRREGVHAAYTAVLWMRHEPAGCLHPVRCGVIRRGRSIFHRYAVGPTAHGLLRPRTRGRHEVHGK
ncbi:MAG: hypothetical protein ACOZCF_00580, partial [Bacillota bacterium]